MRDEKEVLDKIEKATITYEEEKSIPIAILDGARAISYAIVYLGRCYLAK